MLIPPPTKVRHYRTRKGRTNTPGPPPPPPPPPGPLTLASATYEWNEDPENPGGLLTLGFTRAINVSAVNPGVVFVDDSLDAHARFDATGGTTLVDPVTVQFVLVPIGEPVLSGQRLTAAANNGIVAANDGTPWAGCNGIEFT